MNPKAFVLIFLLLFCYSNGKQFKSKRLKYRAKKIDAEILSTPSECARTCRNEEPPKICYYEFTVELYTTLGKACEVCSPSLNNTFDNECQCILADGIEKAVMSVNRQVPGPSIQVCLNDRVVIDLRNQIEGNGITIHWHGVFQQGSQYYDGVPFVTQCPIHQGNTFRYQFAASNAGTHFWHAHTGLQKQNGIFGSLVIREPPSSEIHNRLYDYDLAEHVVLINDWLHELLEERYRTHKTSKSSQPPDSILINGKGQTIDGINGTQTNTPLAIFRVVRGNRYRFRLINSFCGHCGAMLTVQGHTLTVIAVDGEPIKPVKVNSVLSFSGERYDFIVNANQGYGAFWIQVRGVGVCNNTQTQQLAVLSYNSTIHKPQGIPPTYTKGLPLGTVLNAETSDCSMSNQNAISISHLVSARKLNSAICTDKPSVVINASAKFRVFSPKNLYRPNHYEPFTVGPSSTLINGMMNNITFKDPPSPLLSQGGINSQLLCNQTSKPPSCQNENCYCTQIMEVPYKSLVEIFIVDEVGIPCLNHPFHLHGYAFKVVAMGQLPSTEKITLDHVHQLDSKGLIKRCKNNCPGKDTLQIPSNGFAILRFIADNPGYWHFHCHFLVHTVSGMNMVIHVQGDVPPVPPNFPQCGDFTPDVIKPDPINKCG